MPLNVCIRPLPRAVLTVLTALALTATALTPSAAAAPRPGRTVVHTDKGAVRGVDHGEVIEYSGIPYAAPPVGDLRWRPPRPADRWRGVRDAGTAGPDCAQSTVYFRPGKPASEAEDCLYLNVWRPAGVRRPLPVMVWIHGGSYAFGAGADFAPRDMAVQGGAAIVTINYRLGALGFLAHEALDSGGSSGAYGIQDQQAALRWVRRNARAFGGDPGNVTIAGWSAGGASVCTHMISPPARGLFHRAISQSGVYGAGACETRPADAAAGQGRAFAQALGCADTTDAAACLRAKPVAALARAQASQTWSPALGGRTLPLDPATAFRSGRFARVPVLTGTTANESAIYVYEATDAIGQRLTAEDYEAGVRGAFGAAADAVLGRYPSGARPHPASTLSALLTDQGFACGQRRWNRAIAPRVPTYVYEFADPGVPVELIVRPSFPLGAFHQTDLFYLWGVFNPAGRRTPAQDRLAARMIGYWSAFARTGSPGAQGGPRFPRYKAGDPVLRLHPNGDTVDTAFGTAHQCDFWDTL
nr:carboxylesterase family protein [Actinomadura rugatobispora]